MTAIHDLKPAPALPTLKRRSYGAEIDISGHAESRASWERGRKKLGNVYGYEVNGRG